MFSRLGGMDEKGGLMNKKRTLRLLLSIFGFLFFILLPYSKGDGIAGQIGVLENVEITKSVNTLEVRILLNRDTKSNDFRLTKPNRLVIDFFETGRIRASRRINVNDFGIIAVRTGMFKPDIARVVFDLTDQLPFYRIEKIAGGIKVIFWLQVAPQIKTEPLVEKVVEKEAIPVLRVLPVKANPYDSISVDMSGSRNAEYMDVEIFNEKGTKIIAQRLTPGSSRWQTKLESPGEYVVKGIAFNSRGRPSATVPETRVYINFPPVCKVDPLYYESYVGKPVTIDASNSLDPDGKIAKATFVVTNEAEETMDTFSVTSRPLVLKKVFNKEGIYQIPVVVMDDFGATSEPAQVQVVVKQKRVFYLAEVGPFFARGSPLGGYAVGRLGILYNIVPGTLDFILQGGGGQNLISDPWKPFATANVLLNFHMGPVFLGAGSGITTKIKDDRNSDAELIGNFGIEVLGKHVVHRSVFFEVRAPIGKGRVFEDHYKLMAGLRLIF